MTQRLFVYGSLMRGCQHHDRMVTAVFIRAAATSPGYRLVAAGEYPALVRGGRGRVSGELFEVDDHLIRALDEFEDVPELYQRSSVGIDDGSVAVAYVMQPSQVSGLAEIEGGRWRK